MNKNFGHARDDEDEFDKAEDDVHRQLIEESRKESQANKAGFDTRISGNYMNVNDPQCPPYSAFYVMVAGHIQSGTITDRDGICCGYKFMHGTDWVVHSVSNLP